MVLTQVRREIIVVLIKTILMQLLLYTFCHSIMIDILSHRFRSHKTSSSRDEEIPFSREIKTGKKIEPGIESRVVYHLSVIDEKLVVEIGLYLHGIFTD